MRTETITIELTEASVQKAINRINRLNEMWEKKLNRLLEKMVDYGADIAINGVGHIDSGETASTILGYVQENGKGVIVAGGNAIWIEFGTGVTYNGDVGSYPNPLAESVGMTGIGTYGQGKGANPYGWFYYDETGKLRHTHGIKAQMFMYNTIQTLIKEFPDMAREVFDSGLYT